MKLALRGSRNAQTNKYRHRGPYGPQEGENMKTITLYENAKNKVVAFYIKDKLIWTTTYTLDNEGFAIKQVRVMLDGTVIEEEMK